MRPNTITITTEAARDILAVFMRPEDAQYEEVLAAIILRLKRLVASHVMEVSAAPSGPARYRNEAGQFVEDDDVPEEDWP